MSRSVSWRSGILLLLAALAWSGEVRTQPVLLPHDELLKRLDPQHEWLLLPLAEYQALLAASERTATAARPPPSGAWVGNARVRALLRRDAELLLEAELELVSLQPGPAVVRVFGSLPERLGAVELGGQGALAPDGLAGSALLVPGPGRHQVTLRWQTALGGDEPGQRAAVIALPRCAALDLSLRSETPGTFAAPGLVSDGAGGWRLAQAVGEDWPLAWFPGRQTTDPAAGFAADQELEIELADGPGSFRWTCGLEVLRGAPPTDLLLTLPAGFTATGLGGGVTALAGRPDGGLQLRLAGEVADLELTGVVAAGAAIDLPRLQGALYQPGRVRLVSPQPLDYRPGPGWRAVPPWEGAAGGRCFSVAGPGSPLALTRLAGADALAASDQSRLLVGPGPGDWRLEQTLQVDAGARQLFSLPLRLPVGWRMERLTAQDGVVLALQGLGDAGEVSQIPAGGTCGLLISGHRPGQPLRLDLVLVPEAAGLRRGVAPVVVPGAWRESHVLDLLAAPQVALSAGTAALPAEKGWRLDARPQVQGEALRVRLLGEGVCPPVPVETSRRPALCEAQAVGWVHPGAETSWMRLDLRLSVKEGELEELLLQAPFAGDPRCLAGPFRIEPGSAAGLWRLLSQRPFRGEILLRLEGRLAGSASGAIPVLGLSLPEGVLPLDQALAFHAAEAADLVIEPGPGCTPLDQDDLPSWSHGFPGTPVLRCLRLLPGGDHGVWHLVERPAAPLPVGFADRCELRSQVRPGLARTLVRLRLAAPGLQALELGLPTGARLLEASLDGSPATVRSGGVLPLPGRTLMELALLYEEDLAPGSPILRPPTLGGLRCTTTRWELGVEPGLWVRPLAGPADLALSGLPTARRLPWGGWQEAPWPADEIPGLPPPPRAGTDDPRLLQPVVHPGPGRSEPGLALTGHRFAGSRLGGGAPVRLELTPLAELRRGDGLGRLIALLAGVGLAAATWRLRLGIGLASACAAAGLHGLGGGSGPLLGFLEWLGPFAVAAGLLAAAARRVWR